MGKEKERRICLPHFAFHPFIFSWFLVSIALLLHKLPCGLKGFIPGSVSHFQLTLTILNAESERKAHKELLKRKMQLIKVKMKKDAALLILSLTDD